VDIEDVIAGVDGACCVFGNVMRSGDARGSRRRFRRFAATRLGRQAKGFVCARQPFTLDPPEQGRVLGATTFDPITSRSHREKKGSSAAAQRTVRPHCATGHFSPFFVRRHFSYDGICRPGHRTMNDREVQAIIGYATTTMRRIAGRRPSDGSSLSLSGIRGRLMVPFVSTPPSPSRWLSDRSRPGQLRRM
jgi:hypothetical protein